MASLPHLPLPQQAISYLSLLFLLHVLPITISQGPTISTPTIAQCTTSILPLASCAPFVQGVTPTPPMGCCDNLKQLYNVVPNCLCLLLNGTNLSSFPINTTRALQLPDICSLQVNISTCSALLGPPSPPSSHVPPRVHINSTISNATVLASPMTQPTPKPSIVGLGLGKISASFKLKGGIQLTQLAVMFFFIRLLLDCFS
uniref:Bifunctional inhibitor/plant lipid transfer protein/seed storage helical domain-containing protein n=1 Tax=Cucumis sativus TaxID=3659 RepID=A0A0A0LSN1_CUCSA